MRCGIANAVNLSRQQKKENDGNFENNSTRGWTETLRLRRYALRQPRREQPKFE